MILQFHIIVIRQNISGATDEILGSPYLQTEGVGPGMVSQLTEVYDHQQPVIGRLDWLNMKNSSATIMTQDFLIIVHSK